MTNWAILPVKPFSKGKSRLRSVVVPDELEKLNRQCYERTLEVLSQTPAIDRVLVISRDKKALNLAVDRGCMAVYEQSTSNLNAAVRLGLEFITYRDPGRVLIIPSDLPLLKPADLGQLMTRSQKAESEVFLVIVPDLAQQGTNAMLLSHPELVRPAFGRGSFQKHCAQAVQKGAELIVYLNRDIQQDLDTPTDLEKMKFLLQRQPVESTL